MNIQHIYIIGAKNCGAYGGYETFLEKLTEYHQENPQLKYHIAWKGTEKKEFYYHNAHCFQINVPDIGHAQAIYYDVAALNFCIKDIKKHKIKTPIVYILACRIGPFAAYYRNKIHKLGGRVYVNPDGHEWLRAKWSPLIRKYWKLSEELMVKHADLLICDSKNIETYVRNTYSKYKPDTTFIAYGAELSLSKLADKDNKIINWYLKNGLEKKTITLQLAGLCLKILSRL